MSYYINWEKQGFNAELIGSICADDLLAIYESLFSDKRFDDLGYVIFDFKHATQLSITDQDLEKIGAPAMGAATWKKNLFTAYIIPNKYLSDMVDKHFSEYGAFYGNWTYRIFNDISCARKFIAASLNNRDGLPIAE